MLESISIKNYALIKELDINLSSGLNVITGETGAGKSIIIDAVSLLLGNRANKENIRPGADSITVSAQFTVDNQERIREILEENDIESEDNSLVISRKITRSGRNSCRVNGTIIPLSLLKQIGMELVDIHSQHENVSLFKPENQMDLLDAYIGDKARQLLEEIRSITGELRKKARLIRDLQQTEREATRQLSIDKFQYDEITEANLSTEEEDELVEEIAKLTRGEELYERTSRATEILSNETDSPDLSDLVNQLTAELDVLAEKENWYKSLSQRAHDLKEEISALSYQLNRYLSGLDFDPYRLEQYQARAALIDELKLKYGDTIEDVLGYADELSEKIYNFEHVDERLEEEKNAYKELRKSYNDLAEELSGLRKETASVLSKTLENELRELKMEKALFEVEVTTENNLISKTGKDKIRFLISVNPGVKLAELRKVASGGEISRVMLAIKGVFGDKDQIETMVFDEIDTGISGRTAQVVAEKILDLSTKRQIICITHLPQIAAMADTQFLVEKESEGEITEVSFKPLSTEERYDELARMLGGKEVTELTRESAKEMIRQVNRH